MPGVLREGAPGFYVGDHIVCTRYVLGEEAETTSETHVPNCRGEKTQWKGASAAVVVDVRHGRRVVRLDQDRRVGQVVECLQGGLDCAQLLPIDMEGGFLVSPKTLDAAVCAVGLPTRVAGVDVNRLGRGLRKHSAAVPSR